jgi:thiol:disulfide interchange protein/DsbC/DsbD-like thiol-disulfide interchange protein
MAFFRPLFPVLAALLALASPVTPARGQSTAVRDKNVEARLVADVSTIRPGEPFTLGLHLAIDPTWHTYWANPGETGYPTSLALELPPGFAVGTLGFPAPKRFVTDYGFDIREVGYGYETSVLHPLVVVPPGDLAPGQSVTFKGKAKWLMCDPSTCIPGEAELSITLAVGEAAARSEEASLIEAALAKLPAPVAAPAQVSLEGEEVVLRAKLPDGALPEGAALFFHPLQNEILDPFTEPTVAVDGDGLTITAPKHENLSAAPALLGGVLVAEGAGTKVAFELSTEGVAETPPPVAADALGGAADASPAAAAESEEAPFGGGLLGFLLAAFLGGIVLNIMPCVFPVISLKVMSFVGQAGEDRRKVFLHAVAFTLGVLVFFWVLTGVMVALRSFGSGDLGWGVQLRQPGFVIGLIFVMVVVALSLFGVFEIGTSMTAVGGGLVSKAGYGGSFWSGALAVLLATPCTAPLMAPAITFALAQPAPTMFLVFTFLGLGLAAPYFVFAIFPRLLEAIPPPGAWMETFKQLMGFPMLAVAVWLTGVLSVQLDVGGLQWALAGALLVAVAAWILGRFAGYERSVPARTKARLAALLVFVLGVGVAWDASGRRAPASQVDIAEVIAGHRAAGRHVFVDFTAEWCVTCKVNERVALKTKRVQDAFRENQVEFVIADWTNKDADIAAILEEHGRSGVPFYLLYPADTSRPPIRLPDGFITVGDVLEAIGKL